MKVVTKVYRKFSIHPIKGDSNRLPSLEGKQGIQEGTAGLSEILPQSHDGNVRLLHELPWCQSDIGLIGFHPGLSEWYDVSRFRLPAWALPADAGI